MCRLAATLAACLLSLGTAAPLRADVPRSALFRKIQPGPTLQRAVEIAVSRAEPRRTWYCWRYVKDALLAAGAVSTRPTTPYASWAGHELVEKFGFRKIDVHDPWQAPVGSVLVYGGTDGGHVEMRATQGFVSDFLSPTPYPRALLGVFVKPI
jgi:hypothetical protein